MAIREYQQQVQAQPIQVQESFNPGTAAEPQVIQDVEYQQLMGLSKTLMDGTKQWIEQKRKQRDLEMYNAALDAPNPEEVSKEIKDAELKITEDYKVANHLAFASFAENEPEAAVAIRNLTGRDRYFYAKGMAERVGNQHLAYAEEQLASNRTFVGGPNGTFTGAEAEADEVLKRVALKQIRQELIERHGIADMKTSFFNEWAGNTIRKNETALIDQALKKRIINDGQKAANDADSQLASDLESDPFNAISNYWSNSLNARNARGDLYTNDERWNKVSKVVADYIAASNKDIDIKGMEQALIPGDPKNRKYGEVYRAKFLELRDTVRRAKNSAISQDQADQQLKIQEAVNGLIKEAQNNADLATPDAVNGLARGLIGKGYEPTLVYRALSGLEENLKVSSPEYPQYLREKEALQALADQNELMPHHLIGKTSLSQAEFRRQAYRNESGNPAVKPYFDMMKVIAKEGVEIAPDGTTDYTTAQLVLHLEDRFRRELAVEMKKGTVTTEQAAQLAADKISKEVERGRKTKGHVYYQDPNQGGKYVNFMNSVIGPVRTQSKANAVLGAQISQRSDALGFGTAIATPGVFFNKEDLAQIKKLAERDPLLMSVPTSTPLGMKIYTARLKAVERNSTLPEIINRQSLAAGMGTLNTSEVARQLINSQAPNIQGALNRILNGVGQKSDLRKLEMLDNLPKGVEGLMSVVKSGEGGYTSMFPSENYPELANMTIGQVVQFQKKKLGDGRKSAAVGAYQFLYPEVAAQRAGIPLTAKFTKENQDKMFIATILTKPGRENLSKFLKGMSNNIEKAVDELAMEFASVEYRGGKSYYDDGVNSASISRAKAKRALLSAREALSKGNS